LRRSILLDKPYPAQSVGSLRLQDLIENSFPCVLCVKRPIVSCWLVTILRAWPTESWYVGGSMGTYPPVVYMEQLASALL
jgi:hypothetical protein